MKTKILTSVLVASFFVIFASCKDKSCSFEDMEYDSSTKQCECIHAPNLTPPKLLTNGYNTCSDIIDFFYGEVKDNKEYPYFSHEGDTLMVCGWLCNFESDRDSLNILMKIQDKPYNGGTIAESNTLNIHVEKNQLDSIENGQYYVRGVLTFTPLDIDYPIASPSPYSSTFCYAPYFAIKALEIHR